VSDPERRAPDTCDVETGEQQIGDHRGQGQRPSEEVAEQQPATRVSQEMDMGPPVGPHTLRVDDEVPFHFTGHRQPALLPATTSSHHAHGLQQQNSLLLTQ